MWDVFPDDMGLNNNVELALANLDLNDVKFGSIDSHSPMRGHVGHPEASQGDLENQPVL
jgi:hypothetical protein